QGCVGLELLHGFVRLTFGIKIGQIVVLAHRIQGTFLRGSIDSRAFERRSSNKLVPTQFSTALPRGPIGPAPIAI
ncbi:hypothetical protein ACOTDZ_31700, partial [Achromobacter dolens]|uniref:hypothetical protein n=1 Tax=Achromobacter dolens TaxID=1287738 RepID=UPI003BA09295